MAITISKKRAQVLDKLLSFEMDKEQRYFIHTNQEIFSQLINFAEMHYFVSHFSWENDYTILWLIANNKRCDKATALMIFWRACPRFYTQFANEEEAKPAYAHIIFAMLKDILSNWESGFYTHHKLAHDPYREDAFEMNTVARNEKWSIPDSIKVSLPGDVVVVEQ